MMPEPDQQQNLAAAELHTVDEPHYRWWHKVSAVLFVIISFEIGVCLVLIPWSPYWNLGFLSFLPPAVWRSSYLKGAVTGLGFVNIWIALVEVFRLRRFAAHHER